MLCLAYCKAMQKYISFYFPGKATVGVPRLLISYVPKSKGLLHLPTHPLPNNCCHSSPAIARFLILLFASLSFLSIENCKSVLGLNSKYNKTHPNLLNVTMSLPLPVVYSRHPDWIDFQIQWCNLCSEGISFTVHFHQQLQAWPSPSNTTAQIINASH